MFDHILIVCHGNICRSPLAAAMLKQRLPELHIESAGLHAMTGSSADAMATELATVDRLDLSQHVARQLNTEMLQRADLILVMSEPQRLAVIEKLPTATGKVMLFGKWLQSREAGSEGQEIPDPYRKSREAFSHVHRLLALAADSWQQRLQYRPKSNSL